MKDIFILIALAFIFSCNSTQKQPTTLIMENQNTTVTPNSSAIFGGGCFWCIETIFAQLAGVDTVLSGYAGGSIKNPTYNEICTGRTGHAEVIKISYDSNLISYSDLLEVFFNVHNPTTLNQQGNDIGTQYRSCIMYQNEAEKQLALAYIEQIDSNGTFKDKLVTSLEELTVFYQAEDYHQDYYNQNGEQGYCEYVVRPKVEKFQKQFKDKIKK